MTLSDTVTKAIINKLLKGEDYRIEIVTLINAQFLQYSIDFFKKVVDAKINKQSITPDWYKSVFLNDELDSTDIAIHSGLNMKTIGNMYNTTSRQVVIDASNDHYDTLYRSILELVDIEKEIDIVLSIKLNGVSVDLNISETLIVINSLAVKRAALRGGLWSTAGKKVEKPLMMTLCALYNVSTDNYSVVPVGKNNASGDDEFEREIDFYLVNNHIQYKCEVKLMGKGNPESADAVIARHSKVFIADKLSETNIAQFNSLGIQWVQLRETDGFMRFSLVLDNLNIPHTDLVSIDNLDGILERVFSN